MLALLRYAYGIVRGSTVALVMLSLLASASTVLVTFLVGQVVGAADLIATGGDLHGFGWLVGFLVLAFLAMSILPVCREVAAVGVEVRLERAVAAQTLLPLLTPNGTAHLEDSEVQDTYAQASEVDLVTLSRGPGMAASAVGSRLQLSGSAILVGALFVWWLAPILVASVLFVERWIMRSTDDETAAWAGQTQGQRRARYLQQLAMAEGIHELRIFGLARWLADRHSFERRTALAPLQRLRWRFALVRLGVLMGHIAVNVAAVLFAVWSAWIDQLSVGSASAVISAILLIGASYDPANLANARRALAAYRALRSLPIMLAQRYPDPPGRRVDLTAPLTSSIRFHSVCFRYPGQDYDVLHNLDLELEADKAHALVGINGAGKTTLVKLLAGCYRPTAGHITVGGVDLNTLDPESLATWQRQIAAIVQDFLRLPLSFADNISVGAVEHDPDHAAINQAAIDAGVGKAVASLPEGWDTILDRNVANGAELSGGQWQRLALARALYAVHSGAALLVLDEPAAALDVRAEAELVDHYLNLTAGVTSLVISHRFSVVRPADRIFVLDGGCIVESGTHDELIALGGQYATMFRLQAERYLGAEGGPTNA